MKITRIETFHIGLPYEHGGPKPMLPTGRMRTLMDGVYLKVETDEGRIDLLLDTKSGHIIVIEIRSVVSMVFPLPVLTFLQPRVRRDLFGFPVHGPAGMHS